MLIRKLFRTALSYKAQFISMIIMIAMGIGVFLGFNIEWHSIESNTASFFEQTKYADYRLYSDEGFSIENIKSIKNIDGVDNVTRYLSVNASIKDTKKSVTLNVSENYNVSTMLITSGEKYSKNSDGIWLSDRFAQENNLSVGDELTLEYKGIEINGTIIGLAKNSENMICVADDNQLMPDYETHGFAYVSPAKLEKCLGIDFYPQINIISNMNKSNLSDQITKVLGKTVLITEKDLHTSYAGAMSEAEEGKTMGSILPVLFLAIGILTMITTMHRISSNEKIQIGTLKALGFRSRKILIHYTSYGFFIGLIGTILGIVLGYGIAALIISPHGMMSTYLDLPKWKLTMPGFCIPVIVLTVLFLTFISYCSVRKTMSGSTAETLRPYAPKAMKRGIIEKTRLWNKLPFSFKWNMRDIFRHKSRSLMTLIGVVGCMLLIVGGFGMKDTMQNFLNMMDEDINNYTTKINISENAVNSDVIVFSDDLNGDWQATCGIDYNDDTISLDIYNADNNKIRFLDENNQLMTLSDDGVYLCLRLKNTAKVGDTIEFSPYGSEKIYHAKVAGFYRSLVNKNIVMTDKYAEELEIPYHIASVYTDLKPAEIDSSTLIANKQSQDTIMESYDAFMEMMYLMIMIMVIAAVILGVVVLYNLGVMSYVERKREMATLKVLGFRNKSIAKLLVNQNIWLTLIGVLIGIPGGFATLYTIITALASEYELSIKISLSTYLISIMLTFGVSLLVSLMLSKKNRKIDMVESLKAGE